MGFRKLNRRRFPDFEHKVHVFSFLAVPPSQSPATPDLLYHHAATVLNRQTLLESEPLRGHPQDQLPPHLNGAHAHAHAGTLGRPSHRNGNGVSSSEHPPLLVDPQTGAVLSGPGGVPNHERTREEVIVTTPLCCCPRCVLPSSMASKLNKLSVRSGLYKVVGEFGLRENLYYGSIFVCMTLIVIVCFLVINNRGIGIADHFSSTSAALFDTGKLTLVSESLSVSHFPI